MAHQIATDIFYPESDGQPMGETNLHRRLLVELIFALTNFFEGRSDVFVTGDLFFYYVEGEPTTSVCPDVCVIFGVAPADYEVYKTWEDGPFPQVVIELTSASTRRQDLQNKPGLYERLGVLEYYIFDPRPPRRRGVASEVGELQRYRRQSPDQPFGPLERAAPDTVVPSEVLGLGLTVRGQELRLVDLSTGQLLSTSREELVARRAAEERARQADAARQAAEAHARALAEELARLRAELEKRSES